MSAIKGITGRIAVPVMMAFLLVLPGLASAATYYVNSLTGNDATGDGSAGSPWQTITKAAATVPAGTAAAPNIISVAGGTYNASTNGEIFPITFANNYVTLTGAGTGTTFIDPENTTDALHIDARGIAVSGFTFRNAIDADAIVITEGGFNIHHNVFDATVRDGVSFYRPSETDRATSVAFPDMTIANNVFRTVQNGIYVSIEIDFDDTVTGLTASFGNLTITGNTLPLTAGDGIYISSLFNPEDITSGTVTVGNLTVTGNTVTGGWGGIYFWSGVTYMEDAQVSVGNVVVSNNTCTNQTGYGLDLYNWEITYFYGATSAVFGDFTVSGNTVRASNYAAYPNTDGLYLEYLDYIGDIYDETTITTGAITVTDNTVDVNDYGIYFYSYGIWYIGNEGTGDSVTVTTGPRTISGNTLNSNGSYGLYLDLEYIGYEMYGTSAVNYGSFTVSNNTVTSNSEALYVYWNETGYDLDEDSSVSLGSMTISNNTLTSENSGAFFYDMQYCGYYYMEGNGAATFGPTSITGNTLTAGGGEGMEFYFYQVATGMYENASFAMGPITINGNTINAAGGDGINIYYYDAYVGSYLENNATASLPDWIITNNTIDVTGWNDGVEFYTYSNPYDNSDSATVRYGSMSIDGNTFNPDKSGGMDNGIYFYLDDVVVNGYSSSATSFGGITITNNTFYAMNSGAVTLYYDQVGYDFDGSPTLTMGDIEIGNNTIDTAPYGIDVNLNYLYANSSAGVTIGKLNLHDNTLTNIIDDGIIINYYNENGDPTTATLTIGAPTINGNTVSGASATGDGISLGVDNGSAGITFGRPMITGNTVSGFSQGMYLHKLTEATIKCNTIQNNAASGMRFSTAGTGFAVNYNAVVDNKLGLAVDNGFAAVINAENNWWGDALGPAACASCNGIDPGDSGTVDYDPWLTAPSLEAYCGARFPWPMFMPAITGMGR